MKKVIKILIIVITLFILLILYSYFIGNSGLKVKEYKIKNVPKDFAGLKIVHFSDIYYGKHFNEKKLKKVIDKINEINPDIVVFTGDLIDDINDKNIEALTNLLSKINVSIKKYAISGNKDNTEFNKIIKNANFVNLNDTFDIIYSNNSKIMISGLSSNLNDKKNNKLSESITYLENNDVDYKILLLHEPDFIKDITINYDLVLAGHSLGGLVKLPFIGSIYNFKGAKNYHKDHYDNMYISSGLGTYKFHLRLFNKPSINFYRLYSNN